MQIMPELRDIIPEAQALENVLEKMTDSQQIKINIGSDKCMQGRKSKILNKLTAEEKLMIVECAKSTMAPVKLRRELEPQIIIEVV